MDIYLNRLVGGALFRKGHTLLLVGIALELSALGRAQSNDNFANRIVLSGTSWSTPFVSLNSATVEPGEPTEHGTSSASIWYSWTAPDDLDITLSRSGTTGTVPSVAVWVGNSLPTLNLVRNFFSSRATGSFVAVKGTTYQFSLYTNPNAFVANSPVLSLTSTGFSSGGTVVGPDLPVNAAPLNDNFSNRKILASSAQTLISYIDNATRETQEPVSAIEETLWYSYTAAEDGYLNISASAEASYQRIGLYIGDSIPTLQVIGFFSSGLNSFPMTKGITYHLQVGVTGNYKIAGVQSVQTELSFTPSSTSAILVGPDLPTAGGVPANNNFAQRKVVNGSTLRVFGYNTNADVEAFEPAANPKASLWYTWSTDTSGTATITIGSISTVAELLGIWTGTTLNVLSPVTLTAVSGASGRYTFPVLANTPYQIVMGTSSGSSVGLVNFDLAGPGSGLGGAGVRFINISTRAVVATNGNLNPGFVISGAGKKVVLIRGIGPGLAAFGVPNTMADPMLSVYSGSTLIASNDNWSADATEAAALRTAFAASGAFAVPDGSKDAALLLTLDPGAYTAVLTGNGGGGGDTIVEVYDVP